MSDFNGSTNRRRRRGKLRQTSGAFLVVSIASAHLPALGMSLRPFPHSLPLLSVWLMQMTRTATTTTTAGVDITIKRPMQRPATLANVRQALQTGSCGLNKCQANEQNKTKLPEKQARGKEEEGERGQETSKEETDLTDLIVSMQQKCANPKTARERERE